jgi:hypothetical protein
MTISTIIPRLFVIALAGHLLATAVSHAQEISESHLQAAVEAFAKAGAARGFDSVLPAVADRTKNFLIRTRPDLHRQISETVDVVALEMVARRADLGREVAAVWAARFTEEELKQIAAFFGSEAGRKYADIGPQVITDSFEVVQAWSETVAEEMLAAARKALTDQGVEF